MEEQILKQLAQPLLAWYDIHRRILPWREEVSPYRTWVSEIMLQQTRVAAVLPYFQRFMEAFPTVEALAQADTERLMKLWEGLGYYSRARNLQKAARILTEQYGGRFPETYRELTALPGIGDYTAGAILSIAFGQAVPAVDGNVLRVMTRLTDCHDDIADPKTKKAIRAQVQAVMPEAEETELSIDPKDLQIDTFRSSGAGGQHVNKTESAIRITHLPTGTVVECQDERSQYKNKDRAMKILRSKLYEAEQARQNAEIAATRRSQVGTGDRSGKIRTYNFPQGRVTDHRIGLTLYKIDAIMDGALDELIDALVTADQAEKLKQGQEAE